MVGHSDGTTRVGQQESQRGQIWVVILLIIKVEGPDGEVGFNGFYESLGLPDFESLKSVNGFGIFIQYRFSWSNPYGGKPSKFSKILILECLYIVTPTNSESSYYIGIRSEKSTLTKRTIKKVITLHFNSRWYCWELGWWWFHS